MNELSDSSTFSRQIFCEVRDAIGSHSQTLFSLITHAWHQLSCRGYGLWCQNLSLNFFHKVGHCWQKKWNRGSFTHIFSSNRWPTKRTACKGHDHTFLWIRFYIMYVSWFDLLMLKHIFSSVSNGKVCVSAFSSASVRTFSSDIFFCCKWHSNSKRGNLVGFPCFSSWL